MDYLKDADPHKLFLYKKILIVMLLVGILAVFGSAYYFMWSSVPSTIRIKAGVEQKLDLGVPASGKLYREAVPVSGRAANEATELFVDLGRPVTVKANQTNQYHLSLKLFGVIPLKEVNVEVIQDIKLKPSGMPIGIYVRTEGVLVVGIGEFEGEDGQKHHPGKYVFQTGDYILEMNDEEIQDKRDLIDKISHSEGQESIFKVKRGEEAIWVKAAPEINQNGEYKMGIWIRDNAQGVGTMTYIDEQGGFGALGHGINDVDTGTLMKLSRGKLYHTQIIGITRGSNGTPGELTGFIEYDDNNIMGDITDNTGKGIFGVCCQDTINEAEYDYLPIGLKQEIHEGEAEILCSLGDGTELYQVEITGVHLENDNVNRGIVLKITDPELLSATGGIVQGMSGSPIIQDGKLIGAVTHVLVQDPARGYGIFIESMLRD